MDEPVKVLFVCLGNICRSPLAEVVVKEVAANQGLNGRYLFASAGTGSWHIGCAADRRSAATALEHGLDLSGHSAQQITAEKVEHWDWFVAMDYDNRSDLLSMGVPEERVLMMRQFEAGRAMPLDVPDPYYGGPDGFEIVYHMLQENAGHLLTYLEKHATA